MLSPFLAPYVTSFEERFSQGNKAERKETILWFRLFTLRRLRTRTRTEGERRVREGAE